MNHPKHIVAVSGLVRNTDGKVLLIRGPRRGWEFPGGQVEEGEDLIKALKREIKEEAGVNASIGALVGVYSNIKSPTKLAFGFLADYVTGELTTSEESIETKWIAKHLALPQVTNPIIYDRLKDMLDFSGRVIYRVYTSEPYKVCEQSFL